MSALYIFILNVFLHLMFTGFLFHEGNLWKTQNGGSSYQPMLMLRPRTASQKKHLSMVRTFAFCLFVHIFHKSHNLYCVIKQDAIFRCLKVLRLKKIISLNMALSGVFFGFYFENMKKV